MSEEGNKQLCRRRRGQIAQGVASHCEDVDFYRQRDRKPLACSRQGTVLTARWRGDWVWEGQGRQGQGRSKAVSLPASTATQAEMTAAWSRGSNGDDGKQPGLTSTLKRQELLTDHMWDEEEEGGPGCGQE